MELLLFIAAAIALVWASVLFVRGGLIGGCLVVLLAGTCFGHAFFHLDGPLPITAERALLALVVLQYAVYRRLGCADPKPLGKTDWCLIALVALLAVSTFSHNWTVKDYRPVTELLFFVCMPAIVYWVARQAAHSRAAVTAVFAALACFGVYLSLTVVAEVQGQWWAVFPKYIASPEHAEFLGRGRGPLLNPVGTGFLICTCWMAALMAWPHAQRPGKLGLIFLSAIYAAGAYATLTRSVWMGAGLAILVLLGLTLPKVWRPVVLGGVCAAAVVFVAAQWESLSSFKREKHLSATETAESAELRPILAMVAWQMFKDRPVLGCGFGQYEQEFPKYLSDRSTPLVLEKVRRYTQHNTFLAYLTETGLIGMGLLSAVLIGWGGSAWRLWKNAAAPLWSRQIGLLLLLTLAAYLPNAMFHDMALIPMTTMSLFFLAGVSTGLAYRNKPPAERSTFVATRVARREAVPV